MISHLLNLSAPRLTMRIPLERLRPSGSSGDRGKDNSSPFVHSSHGNPAFTPQKMGKGGVVVSDKEILVKLCSNSHGSYFRLIPVPRSHQSPQRSPWCPSWGTAAKCGTRWRRPIPSWSCGRCPRSSRRCGRMHLTTSDRSLSRNTRRRRYEEGLLFNSLIYYILI